VVIVLAARLDVQRQAGLHREALERVREERDGELADAVTAEGERDLGVRSPDEVDGGGRARFVHRHGRRAVAGDADTAVERRAEGVPEGGKHVLDRVVLVDVEIAAGDQLEIEPPWKASRVSRWSRSRRRSRCAPAGRRGQRARSAVSAAVVRTTSEERAPRARARLRARRGCGRSPPEGGP
jgi:hypothetical protein